MVHLTFPKPQKQRKTRKGLRRTDWIKHRQNLGAISSNTLRSERAQLERERKAEKKAKVSGCEYFDFLRLQFGKLGCPFQKICKNFGYGRCHVHHVKEGSSAGMGQRGLAEDSVPLCAKCHIKGDSPSNSFRSMEEEAGVNLRQIANDYAAQGFVLGYLPVEKCDECREFHSAKFMLDEMRTDGSIRRVCSLKCAGPALKETGDESALW